MARTGSVVRLGRAILEDARRAGAQVIVVGCPMCQSNLDMRQTAMAHHESAPFNIPIVYVTQLVGMALGCDPRKLGLSRHFVDTAPLARFTPSEPATSAPNPQKEA
jgi:heterodisulfide reductase subunit B